MDLTPAEAGVKHQGVGHRSVRLPSPISDLAEITMSRIVRIFEGVVLGFLDIHKLRPRLNSDSCLDGLDQSLDVKARASMGEVTEQLKSRSAHLVGASMLLPSKSKI